MGTTSCAFGGGGSSLVSSALTDTTRRARAGGGASKGDSGDEMRRSPYGRWLARAPEGGSPCRRAPRNRITAVVC